MEMNIIVIFAVRREVALSNQIVFRKLYKMSKNNFVILLASILALSSISCETNAQSNKSSKSKVNKSSKVQAKNPSKAQQKERLVEINVGQSFALKDCATAMAFPNQLIPSDAISAYAANVIGWGLSKANFEKGEFETTNEYEKRLDTLSLFVGGKDSLVFKIPISPEFKSYNADTEMMSVSLPIASGTNATLAGSSYFDKALSIDHIEKAGKTVAGQTAIGIKFNYTIYYERSSFVVIDNDAIKSFKFKAKIDEKKPNQQDPADKINSVGDAISNAAMELNKLDSVSSDYDSENVLIKMPRDKAIKISNNMYLLLIGSWRKPYYYTEDFEDRASLDNPYYTFSTVESFYVQPRCAYLVDKLSGEVLHTYLEH